MKKLLFIAIIVLVLSLSFSFAANKFSDVAGTKYESAVTKLNSLNIVDGFTDGTFKPENSVTRAQLCKMLVEALDLERTNNVALTQFDDVSSTQWFYNYVKIAVDNGVIKGYTDGTFKPNNDVKFSELFTMIIRAMKKENQVVNPSNWPNSYIEFAQSYGLTKSVTYGAVEDAANRGEVSVAIYNMVNKLESDPALNIVKAGFVESVSSNSGVKYAVIDGDEYPISSNSDSFEEDTYAVFNIKGLAKEITLVKYFGVKDLDGNANIINAVSGTKAGDQEVRYVGSSSYVDYFTTSNKKKYRDYSVCLITVKVNSKDNLVVSKHTSYSSLENVKFAIGDRVVADSKNEVFLIFRGLDVNDIARKGKLIDSTVYYTVSYEWNYGEKPAGVSLPKSETVESGTTYKIKYPTFSGLQFYCTNINTDSFVVKKDTTIYLSTIDLREEYLISYAWAYGQYCPVALPANEWVLSGTKYTAKVPANTDEYEFHLISDKTFTVNKDTTIFIDFEEIDQGGYAGSNMPLIDRVAESRLKQEITGIMFENMEERYGSDVYDVRVNITKLMAGDDTDEVKFECECELRPATEEDADKLTIPDGYYDEDSGWVLGKHYVGIIYSFNDETFTAYNIGTGW